MFTCALSTIEEGITIETVKFLFFASGCDNFFFSFFFTEKAIIN